MPSHITQPKVQRQIYYILHNIKLITQSGTVAKWEEANHGNRQEQ